jgi:hypothetical protein
LNATPHSRARANTLRVPGARERAGARGRRGRRGARDGEKKGARKEEERGGGGREREGEGEGRGAHLGDPIPAITITKTWGTTGKR